MSGKPEYRTIEELEVAFQAILATMSDDQREVIMHRIDTMEVTNEDLDQFNRDYPGFSEQVMALYRERMAAVSPDEEVPSTTDILDADLALDGL